MRKSTKMIATVVAVALVISATLIAIYAATAGGAGVTASVSWTATQTVDLEFWATASGGVKASGASDSIEKVSITPTMTNSQASRGNIGSLSRSFSDTDNDGVNNPAPLTFSYYVKNKSLTPLNVMVTVTPNAGDEAITTVADTVIHTPKVELFASVNSSELDNSSLYALIGSSGYDIPVDATLEYKVVVSLASSGTNNGINADTSVSSFDAGVAFNFGIGSSALTQTAPVVSTTVGTTAQSPALTGQTLGEYLNSVVPDKTTIAGWFFDNDCTMAVTDDYLDKLITKTSNLNLHTVLATDPSYFTFTAIDGTTCNVKQNADKNPSGDIIIPAYINIGGSIYKVTEIYTASSFSSGAFYNNTNITSVILPNTIVAIGESAFTDCSGLTSITIPNSVINIGDNAFAYCSSLTSVTIPNSVTSIEGETFMGCSGLTSVTIPDSVTSIGMMAFTSCKSLTSITIPNSVTSIGNTAFSLCSGLTSVTIPNSVTSIGSNAFAYCSKLTSATFENTNGWKAGTTTLTSVNLSNTSTAATYLKTTYKSSAWTRS